MGTLVHYIVHYIAHYIVHYIFVVALDGHLGRQNVGEGLRRQRTHVLAPGQGQDEVRFRV